nr:parathymosin-like [Leptinotarsa decemlineata]
MNTQKIVAALNRISAIDANNWKDESDDEDANIPLEEVLVEEGVGVDEEEIDLGVHEVENEANENDEDENETNESDEDDDMVDELVVDGEDDDEGDVADSSEGDGALKIGLRLLNIIPWI